MTYISFLNVRVPETKAPVIGIDFRPCPHCGKPLSCSNGRYWCRRCSAEVKEAVQKYIKTIKEGK